MTYVDFTQNLIHDVITSYKARKLLVFAPMCSITEIRGIGRYKIHNIGHLHITRIVFEKATIDIVQPVDFFETLQRTLEQIDSFRYDVIILPRVMEHIEFRKLDWFITLLAYNLVSSGTIHVIVPDMSKALEYMRKALADSDDFKIRRNIFEIFNEGQGNDRHATWTDPDFITYYLEREGHFKVTKLDHVQLDGSEDVVAPNLHVIAKRR